VMTFAGVASNFAGCEKLLLDAQAHFMLAHYHPTLVSRLDMDRFQRVDLATDVLIPISAPAAKPGRGGRSSKKAQPRYALPGASGAPLPYLAYHPGSGVGRLVTSFLATKDPSAWLAPGFAAPVMLLIDMAREGRGVTWAPMTLVRADLDNGRLLRARFNWLQRFYHGADVEDRSVYGTGVGFRGHAKPGDITTFIGAVEYSVTREWVLAFDVTRESTTKGRLRGSYGGGGPTIDERFPWTHYVSFAPAIEYNWSDRTGAIFGVWVIPKGHNVPSSVTPALAISRFW